MKRYAVCWLDAEGLIKCFNTAQGSSPLDSAHLYVRIELAEEKRKQLAAQERFYKGVKVITFDCEIDNG